MSGTNGRTVDIHAHVITPAPLFLDHGKTRLQGFDSEEVRSDIAAAMSTLTSSLEAVEAAVRSGQVTAARRYLEAAQQALDSLKAMQ